MENRKMMIKPRRWKQAVDVKPQGSITLGFLDATVETTELGDVELSNIVVRLTVDGVPSFSFPRRTYVVRGETRSADLVRVTDEAKYRALCAAIFALPAVQTAVSVAEQIRAALMLAQKSA